MDSLYTEEYYEALKQGSRISAAEIVPLVLELIQPKSVVDIGCGSGAWLSVFEEFGVVEYLGVDGDYIDENMLEIPPDKFISFDLTNPFLLDREFDLVVSLEVAEHLPAEYAETFIDSITHLGPVVLFSAAIPLQGGANHINEQWPRYWVQHFQKHGCMVVDCLRKKIWNNENVDPWYAQNILIFVRQDQIENYPSLKKELEHTNISQLAKVHPKHYRQYRPEARTGTLSLSAETTHTIQVEVTEPIPDVSPPSSAERLHCIVKIEGADLGTVELPICGGFVPGHILGDAIVGEFAWPVLNRFFEHTLYPNFKVEQESTGLSIYREGLCLAEGLSEDGSEFWRHVHNQIGWTVFLQELWARPEWPKEYFYNSTVVQETAPVHNSERGWFVIEVSANLPGLEACGSELNIFLTVGGVALGLVTLPHERKIVAVQELRAILTSTSGFELCRAAVREGLLGRPLTGPESLRERLAAAAAEAAQLPDWLGAPGSAHAVGCALAPDEPSVVLGRRSPWLFGTSASRRAVLPAAAARELINAAAVTGEPVLHVPLPGEMPRRVLYAPDLIWQTSRRGLVSAAHVRKPHLAEMVNTVLYTEGNLESLLMKQFDLKISSGANEPVKYELAPALIRATRIAQVIELACEEGYPTAQSVPHPTTDRLPILTYHRIAPIHSSWLNSYQVTPEAFEKQLQYLRDSGYYSISLEEWYAAIVAQKSLPGRAVLIVFNGGYLDFLTHAWPLLKHYGFYAMVFLTANQIGESNYWDYLYGEEVTLLSWQEIRQLQGEGIEFGSYSASQQPLTSLSPTEVAQEGARSRTILTRGLGVPVNAFSYPYGDTDRVIEHLIGACGYTFGLSGRQGRCTFYDPLLALPRLEVMGYDDLQTFITKLSCDSLNCELK